MQVNGAASSRRKETENGVDTQRRRRRNQQRQSGNGNPNPDDTPTAGQVYGTVVLHTALYILRHMMLVA
jgi:hypothetical protein